MASTKQALVILVSIFTASFLIKSSHAGQIAIYWGQNVNEGSLTDACDTGDYDIVLLAFLIEFGSGRTPKWNFAGHCGDWSPCTKLEPEIEHCQSKGIKVFLSLGGDSWGYSLSSPADAKEVANYLYNNFLSGQYGPLGSVTLDGIDLDIEHGSNLYYDDLVKELDALRQPKKFYLSAAPQCPIPDYYLDAAIKTGLLDYVFVQFYNNPSCQYSESDGTAKLFQSWSDWSSLVGDDTSLFLGLPASVNGAPSGGYIPPDVLKSQVLPYVKKFKNYGGVMLWSRFHDIQSSPTYSHQIRDSVLNSALQAVKAISDAIFECVSSNLYRMLPHNAPRRLRLNDL